MTTLQTTVRSEEDKRRLNKQLETFAWAAFFISWGISALMPDWLVPHGEGALRVGFILLGLNAARFLLNIPVSYTTVVLGVLAIFIGLGQMIGFSVPLVALLMILVGANLIRQELSRPAV